MAICDRPSGGDGSSAHCLRPSDRHRLDNAARSAPSKAETANQILAGDTLRLDVGPGRFIPAGRYAASVQTCLKFKPNRMQESYVVSVSLGRHRIVSVRVTIYRVPLLDGQCFLGPDRYPVSYTHEPNLEERLRRSLHGA